MGGDTLEVEVSAKAKTNLDKLLEVILLQSEVLDSRPIPIAPPKASSSRPSSTRDVARLPPFWSIAARSRSAISSWPVRNGVASARSSTTMAPTSTTPARPCRSRFSVSRARPMPATAWRWSKTRPAAREITEYRIRQKRENVAKRASGSRGSLEQMMSKLQTAGKKEFPLVVKTDVQGSLEAIVASLEKLGNEEVAARVIHGGVGGVTEVRRHAGLRVRRGDHRLQPFAPTSRRAMRLTATASRSATTTSSTTSSTT